MNRADFGQLVAALRKENIDLLEGKVWTQKRLAERANLPERAIAQIEQGTKMNMEGQVVAQLAEALGLTTMERVAFLHAAAEVDVDPYGKIAKTPTELLEELLSAAREIRLPAYVYDAYGNLVAINSTMRALAIMPDELWASGHASPAGFNVQRYYFAPTSPIRTFLGINWTQFAIRLVQHFRVTTLKYRHTERFRIIFRELYQYPLFQDFWARTKYADEDLYHRWDSILYQHPELGQLNYIATEVSTLTGLEELFLVTYIPRDRQTTNALEALAERVGTNLHRAAAWPYED